MLVAFIALFLFLSVFLILSLIYFPKVKFHDKFFNKKD